MKRFPLLLALGLAVNPAQALFIVAPFSWDLADGDTSTSLPFDIGAGATMRFQQVFNASDFLPGAPDGGYISEIWFRPDAESGRYFENRVLPGIQINLSTTSHGADSLSPVFADNIGSGETVVFGRGPLVLSGFAGSFSLTHIELAQPFFYNPHAGNLLMDIRNFGGGDTTYFDATEVVGDSVSRVWAWDANSASGTLDTRGLITGFSVTPVPEPSAALLLIVGLGVWALYARHRLARSSRREEAPTGRCYADANGASSLRRLQIGSAWKQNAVRGGSNALGPSC